MEDRLDQLELKQREKNILIFGLKVEASNQTPWQAVHQLFENILEVRPRITRANYFGKWLEGQETPIIVELATMRDKIIVLQNTKKLAGKPISIRDDLPIGIREKRRSLMEAFKEQKRNGRKVTFRGGTLFVDGAPFVQQTATNLNN